MRNSGFCDKVVADMEKCGMPFAEETADKAMEMLNFLTDSMDIMLQDEILDIAYIYYGINKTSLTEIYTIVDGDLPEYLKTTPPFEKDGQYQYRGFDIISNILRFRSGLLGESKGQEDYNKSLLYAILLNEYASCGNILQFFSEEASYVMGYINSGILLLEKFKREGDV